MPARIVRCEHESLVDIAGQLTRTATGVRQSTRQVQRNVEALRAGGWKGLGATAFYREMDSEVSPRLERLAVALENSASATRRIHQIFLDAEQEAGLALAPGGSAAGPAVLPGRTGGTINVSGLPAGRIRDAAAELAKSKEAVDSNTARHLAAGTVKAYYVEDLKHPPDEADKLKKAGLDPKAYTYYVHPDTGADMLVQKNYSAFAMDGAIFGTRTQSLADWKQILAHETNHVVNGDAATTDILQRFKGEFRAYWVVEYRGIADPAKRAEAVQKRVLRDYPYIADAAAKDANLAKSINGHSRPDGDLINKGSLP